MQSDHIGHCHIKGMSDGEVLPSVRQMADEIGINMHTVNKAYTILRQEGFVKVDRRRGAFVSVSDRNRERAIRLVEKDMRVILAGGEMPRTEQAGYAGAG